MQWDISHKEIYEKLCTDGYIGDGELRDMVEYLCNKKGYTCVFRGDSVIIETGVTSTTFPLETKTVHLLFHPRVPIEEIQDRESNFTVRLTDSLMSVYADHPQRAGRVDRARSELESFGRIDPQGNPCSEIALPTEGLEPVDWTAERFPVTERFTVTDDEVGSYQMRGRQMIDGVEWIAGTDPVNPNDGITIQSIAERTHRNYEDVSQRVMNIMRDSQRYLDNTDQGVQLQREDDNISF